MRKGRPKGRPFCLKTPKREACRAPTGPQRPGGNCTPGAVCLKSLNSRKKNEGLSDRFRPVLARFSEKNRPFPAKNARVLRTSAVAERSGRYAARRRRRASLRPRTRAPIQSERASRIAPRGPLMTRSPLTKSHSGLPSSPERKPISSCMTSFGHCFLVSAKGPTARCWSLTG